MGKRYETRVSVGIAAALSLLLHALVLASLGDLSALAGRADPRVLFLAEEPMATPPEEEDQWEPGIERGDAASLSWIGYEEYEEHLARLAEVEQAAFTLDEQSGAPAAAPVAPQFEDPALAQQMAEPIESPESAESASPEAPEMATTEGAEEAAPLPAEAAPDVALSSQAAQQLEHLLAALRALQPERLPVRPEPVEPTEEPRPETPGQEGPQVPDAASAEKESDATSIERIPPQEWNNGKPIAREGLEIRPFSLHRHLVEDFGDYQLGLRPASAVRRNPIVRLRFDRSGKAAEVVIVRGTENVQFDRLYLPTWMARWTARGPKLAELGPGEMTGAFEFTIIFVAEETP